MKRRPFVRVIGAADTHAGHKAGLTPPNWWSSEATKWGQVQRECWNYFASEIDKLRPIDVLLLVGDLVHGPRASGSDLLAKDMDTQTDIITDVVKWVKPQIVRACYGTPRHVGEEDNWEKVAIDKISKHIPDSKLSKVIMCEINGKHFYCKHKISRSSVEPGKPRPIIVEIMKNRAWHKRGIQDKADVALFAHVHYSAETKWDGCKGFILPSLQGLGDSYGATQVGDVVEFGFMVFDVYDDGRIECAERILEMPIAQADRSERLQLAR